MIKLWLLSKNPENRILLKQTLEGVNSVSNTVVSKQSRQNWDCYKSTATV